MVQRQQTGGSTAEDSFFGVINPNGIIALRVSNTIGGIELDHLQTSSAAPSPVPIGPVVPGLLVFGLSAIGARTLGRR